MPNSEPSKKTTQAELEKLLDAHPRFTKYEPVEGRTTVRFLGKKQTEVYKRQIKAAEDKKKRNK